MHILVTFDGNQYPDKQDMNLTLGQTQCYLRKLMIVINLDQMEYGSYILMLIFFWKEGKPH